MIKKIKKIENNNEVILALDIASHKTGYAIYKNGKIAQHGTWQLSEDVELVTKVNAIVVKNKVTDIVAEDIFHSKEIKLETAYRVLCECRGIVKAVAKMNNIQISFINPLMVKKRIWNYGYHNSTLSRQEQKQRMINRITKSYGYSLENSKADDEADAIGILIVFLEKYDLPVVHPHQ